MTIRVTTRHPEDFDIHMETINPALSSNAQSVCDYVRKITAFYNELKIRSAMWTVPESQRTECLQPSKPVEYVLEIEEDRAVAYVDELTWSDYLYDNRETFDYSRTPTHYKITSIIVPTPITKTELKAIRRYRQTNGPDKYELVEETIL